MGRHEVDTVVRHFELRRDGEVPPVEDFHPGVELWTPDTWPDGRHHVGVQAIADLFDRYFETWEVDALEWEEPMEMGNKVIVRFSHRLRGKTSDVAVENRATGVYGFREGKIAWMGFFFDHREALLAAETGGRLPERADSDSPLKR
jgi:ketosteroid isomerase-like protein